MGRELAERPGNRVNVMHDAKQAAADKPLLELRNVSKRFGATQALREAGLSVYPGEVHGLLGANGSGKSTMLKILSGFVPPDVGAELYVNGLPAPLPSHSGAYRKLGWGFVHQDLALFPTLRVVDNFHLTGPLSSPGWALSWRRESARAVEILRRFHLDLDPRGRVDALRPGQRALLAIARAMYEAELHSDDAHGRRVLFLDESTVSLEARDRSDLERVITGITSRGWAVVLVSHNLAEVRQLTHRITVLRDGRVVGTDSTANLTRDTLLTLVAGGALSAATNPHSAPAGAQPALVTTGLTGNTVQDVGFTCYKGEILGMTGLAGSGFEEVPYLLFGEGRGTGTVRVGGTEMPVRKLRPAAAIAAGLCLVPGDRRTQGAVAGASIGRNVTLASLPRYRSHLGWLSSAREKRDAAAVTAQVGLVPPDTSRLQSMLSGGNQQKVVLAKWLNVGPKVLMSHEPTIGIDVRARAQIYELLRATAREGTGIICASGDLEQLELLCNRVIVFRDGSISAELHGASLNKTNMTAASLDVQND